MNIYVIERETLIQLIRDASVRGLVYFERDILARNLSLLNVHAYEYTGYAARIADMKSYFDEIMRLLEGDHVDQLFDPSTRFTRRFVTITPPATLKAARSRTLCWPMVV